MKNKESQKTRVLGQLKQYGFITRNSALRNYISRLSAIILDLKKDGYEIEGKDMKNGDYVYKWINRK